MDWPTIAAIATPVSVILAGWFGVKQGLNGAKNDIKETKERVTKLEQGHIRMETKLDILVERK